MMATEAAIDRQEALTRLMRQYEKDVLKLCCAYLRDLSLAEDATQETFLKAYRALGRFRGESGEKTWLMRIAINTCKDIRRAAWFRFVDRKVTLDQLPPPAVAPSTENVLLSVEIMRLPAREREVILLNAYQGLTRGETAQALGISEAAVSKRIKRARERLGVLLEGGKEHA